MVHNINFEGFAWAECTRLKKIIEILQYQYMTVIIFVLGGGLPL